jgi:hypothetical protein
MKFAATWLLMKKDSFFPYFDTIVKNKRKVSVQLILYLLIITQTSFCQVWPKNYFPGQSAYPYAVDKCYDKGYLIGGWYVTSIGAPINGWIIKTDINGTMLWNKQVGEPVDGVGIRDITSTLDGGTIVSGSSHQYDYSGDPFIMKLNACGEKEWCRLYSYAHEIYDYAASVYQIPGGYISQISRGTDLYAKDHVFLFRLDVNGDLVWQQQYALSDPLLLGAKGEHMMITSDSKYIISGWCYYPDSGTVNPKYLRPLLIKVDSAGTTEWERPWNRINGEDFYGQCFRSITDNNHNIYSCGRHIESSATPPGDRPTMLVTNPDGNEMAYHDMVTDSWQAVIFTINWFSDSTIALGGGWTVTGADEHEAIFKVDRSGNILDSIQLIGTSDSFADALIDADDKLFIVSPQYANNQWQAYAWKLNSDLEYDTLYNHPFVYDSLCPHPIASDTIPLDCVIVGIDEPFENPATGKLKVYPNPANDFLCIEIPEKLKAETKNEVFSLTTLYSQWESATLELYDLFGRKMFTEIIHQQDKNLHLDITTWPSGMYVVRLVYKGNTVASEKVVKE